MRTEFVQYCPVCGRPLQIRVAYLGRRMRCDHCGGRFIATAAEQRSALATDELLARAEELLHRSSQQLSVTQGPPGC